MKAAIAQLQISLETLKNNEPIHRAEGNIEQAEMEYKSMDEITEAIGVLQALERAENRDILDAIRSKICHGGLVTDQK